MSCKIIQAGQAVIGVDFGTLPTVYSRVGWRDGRVVSVESIDMAGKPKPRPKPPKKPRPY